MSVKIRKKAGRLYLDIYFNGTRRWEALRLSVSKNKEQNKHIMELAEICRSKREAQLVGGEWGVVDATASRQPLYQYIERLGEDKKPNDRTVLCLRYLEKYANGKTIKLYQITAEWFEGFQEWLLKESGLGQTSAASYAAAVRGALRKAERDALIMRNPTKGVKGVAPLDADKDFLSYEEVLALSKISIGGMYGKEVKNAFLFMCFTGLRISDVKTLKWDNIDVKTRGVKKRQFKTRNIVFIPRHETAWRMINDGSVHRQEDPVFPLLSGSKSNLTPYFRRWGKAAGVGKEFNWHTARHTFAVMSLESGTDVYTLSKLLGHTNIRMTEIYAKATDKKKREAIDALPALEAGGPAGKRRAVKRQ